MIKREDVIVDPKDPRVKGLMMKRVICGNSFRELVHNEDVPHVLVAIGDNSSPFRSGSDYGYTMIAPIPELTYRPFKSAEEFKPYRDKWVKSHQNNGTFKIDWHSDDFIYEHGESVITWETAFEDYYFEDGTPFGVKE